MAKSISISFDGYWRDVNRNGVPSQSGVYCVYRGTFDATAGTVSLKQLLYIGESDNVHDRLANHECEARWKRHLGGGEVLVFSFGAITSDRVRAEAAMIYHHQPPVNIEYKDNFPYETTLMTLGGTTALLQTSFTISKTAKSLWG